MEQNRGPISDHESVNPQEPVHQDNFSYTRSDFSQQAELGGCERRDCSLPIRCWTHDRPFFHRSKDGGEWHSHRIESGWCNFALPTGAGVDLATGVTPASPATEVPDPHPYFPAPIPEEEMRHWKSLEPALLDIAKKLVVSPRLESYAQQLDLDSLRVKIVPTCGPNTLGIAEGTHWIFISSWLLPDEQRLLDTLAHETGHVLCFQLGLSGPAHGPNFEHMVELLSPGSLERARSWRPSLAVKAARLRFHLHRWS